MNTIQTQNPDFRIRFATEVDVELILSFIKELADYEHMSKECVATAEVLSESLFVKHQAEAIIGEYQGVPVGFALFFHNFSTFLGKANMFLEDLYVKQAFRGFGFGKELLAYLAVLCKERNCERLDWYCLKWNEPSIQFYQKTGAKVVDEWIVYRAEGQALHALAERL